MFARHLVSTAEAALLEERARRMRFAPTAAEAVLWRELSGSKLGVGFRRQLVIGNFIVDFACTKVRLVVEVDGQLTRGASLGMLAEIGRSPSLAGACSESPMTT